jgi:hypothetical protein
MSETKGHFERGRWVEDPEPAPVAPTTGSAGRHPPGTPDAHEQIEQAARKAGEDLERAINAWAASARQGLQKG